MYLLRASPCFTSNNLVLYDNALRDSLSLLTNADLSGSSWDQASLPVWTGELGVHSAALLAPSAFLASAVGTATLVSQILPSRFSSTPDLMVPLALSIWEALVGPGAVPPTNSSSQRAWDTLCCTAAADVLLTNHTDLVSQARLKAVRTKGADNWLHALPLANIGLKLDDMSLEAVVALRLGAPAMFEHTCCKELW